MDNALNQHSKNLAEWAVMGRKFNQPMAIPDWGRVKPFIESCQNFLEDLKKETKTLLEKSSKQLYPFQDPFCIDLSSNKWFAGSREEGYSDWLAWIIRQLKDHSLVFRLLDIPDDESMLKECEGINPDVKREEGVKKGHEGQEGRLDITIRYQSKLLIHVEVKVVSAEEAGAGLDKNKGYIESLEKKDREVKKKQHRLLVTESQETSYDYEFEGKKIKLFVLKWADICIKLRNMVLEKQMEQPLVASLILSFAGAVEQNLLGLSNINKAYFDSRTFYYIKKFLKEDVTMGKSETEEMRNQFVENGLDSYLDALTAVREFQKPIIERSRRALEEKLNDLSKAMEIDVKREEIKDYTYPAKLADKELGVEGWVAVTFSKEPVYCYFGLSFEREDSKCVTKVVVLVYTYTASQRDFLLEHCKKVSKNFTKDNWNISLDMPISKEEINNFEAKLQDLIDKWIEVWKKVGGIKNLPKK